VLASYTADQHEKIALRRASQAEALARNVYVRILSSNELAGIFSSDSGLDELWARPPREIHDGWGTPMDLNDV
jgi:hypothetical protein